MGGHSGRAHTCLACMILGIPGIGEIVYGEILVCCTAESVAPETMVLGAGVLALCLFCL